MSVSNCVSLHWQPKRDNCDIATAVAICNADHTATQQLAVNVLFIDAKIWTEKKIVCHNPSEQ